MMMHPLFIGVAAFLAIFGGALLGIRIGQLLPETHTNADARNAITISMAVLGTLAALVLSLLLNSASSSFVERADAVSGLAAGIQRLDHSLHEYGPDAVTAHVALGVYARRKAAELSGERPERTPHDALEMLDQVNRDLMLLTPHDEYHRLLRDRALHVAESIGDERWRLARKSGAVMPVPFLVLLIFWLALLFTSFGLFAPRNATVLVSLLFCAIAISGGIYLIVEMATPTGGMLRTPVEPLMRVAAEMR